MVNGLDRLAGAVMEKMFAARVGARANRKKVGWWDNSTNYKRSDVCRHRAMCEFTGEIGTDVRRAEKKLKASRPGRGTYDQMMLDRGFEPITLGRGMSVDRAYRKYGDGVFDVGSGRKRRPIRHAFAVINGFAMDHTRPTDWPKSWKVRRVWVRPGGINHQAKRRNAGRNKMNRKTAGRVSASRNRRERNRLGTETRPVPRLGESMRDFVRRSMEYDRAHGQTA